MSNFRNIRPQLNTPSTARSAEGATPEYARLFQVALLLVFLFDVDVPHVPPPFLSRAPKCVYPEGLSNGLSVTCFTKCSLNTSQVFSLDLHGPKQSLSHPKSTGWPALIRSRRFCDNVRCSSKSQGHGSLNLRHVYRTKQSDRRTLRRVEKRGTKAAPIICIHRVPPKSYSSRYTLSFSYLSNHYFTSTLHINLIPSWPRIRSTHT